MAFVDALRGSGTIIGAELRPPRAELDSVEGMDAWIDTYHAVRSLTRQDVRVFLTDSAVGTQEENNLRHLVTNFGADVARDRIVPFLTSKHSLEYCLTYAEQAWQHGFPSLVVLGGDRTIGRARCVAHAWQLREEIRKHQPHLSLGGWANPHANPAEQVGHLLDAHATAEFYLTQIVSHHSRARVAAFLEEAGRRGLRLPGMFGVFYYRSANAKTLAALGSFLPVPAAELTAEFASGATADAICARTIRELRDAGVRHFYVSNLPLQRAAPTLARIMAMV